MGALAGCSAVGGSPAALHQDVEILPAPRSSTTSKLAAEHPTPSTRERSEREHWYSSEEQAVAMAREEGRPLLIDFRAEWCLACKELETKTYPGVLSELHRFVLLRVDATDEEEPSVKQLLERYKVEGLPTVLLLDGKGREVGRFKRFVDVSELRDALLRVP